MQIQKGDEGTQGRNLGKRAARHEREMSGLWYDTLQNSGNEIREILRKKGVRSQMETKCPHLRPDPFCL